MFSSRRRRKASPEPESSLSSPSFEATPESGRRRRRISDADKNGGSTPVLPTFRGSKKKPPSKLPTFQAGNNFNTFCLGGQQFYPGKDKKRKLMRKKTVWHRIFCSSPWRIVVSVLLVSYVLLWHVLVPATHALLNFGRTISAGKHGFMNVSPLTLPSLRVQQTEAARLQQERDRLHYDRRQDERLKVLERIAPSNWYPLSDVKKKKKIEMEPKARDTAADHGASDDETAHQQHSRRDGVELKRRKRRERHGRSESSDGKVEKRGAWRVPPEADAKQQEVVKGKNNTKPVPTARKDKVSDVKPADAISPNATKTNVATVAAVAVAEGRLLRRTLQNMDSFPVQSSCSVELSTAIQTTLVIQSSLERLWILQETCKRWKSPIVAAVYLPHGLDENHHSIVTAKKTCPQLTVVALSASRDATEWAYPVNRLRNIALDAVQTSHVLVADIDFVPSADLDETIRSTIVEQEPLLDSSQHEAMIVPAFEKLPPEPCTKGHDCSVYLKGNSSFIPQSLGELQACIVKKDCSVFQQANNWEGHYSTRSESWLKGAWYEENVDAINSTKHAPATKRIRTIKCFDSLRYEPYVVLRWCPVSSKNATEKQVPVAPYYDERFYGYGKNKIQLISHLRFMGYHFSVLPRGFIVHNPHADSAAKEVWNNAQKKLHQEMDALYPEFLEELWSKYKGTTDYIVQQCKRPQKKDKKRKDTKDK